MKITIKTTANSLDPNATTENPQASLDSYIRILTKALQEEFPEAEIEHEPSDDPYEIHVSDDDNGLLGFEVQRISENVYEEGMFWE